MPRVRGEGSIVQLEKDKPKGKCRKWQLRVPCGKDPRDGKYKTRTKRVRGTLTEAKAMLRDFIAEVEGGEAPGRAGTTFADECDRLMRNRRASGNYSDARMKQLDCGLKAICAYIGDRDFLEVSPTMLNDMYASMRAGEGTLTGKPASGAYVRSLHHMVSLVYNQAMREGRVAANPAHFAEPPKKDSEPKKALSSAQLDAMVSQLEPTEEHDCAWLLAATLGLRRGEICGLSWGDVDLDEAMVSVEHSYDSSRNLKAPKTAAGRRTLPLMPETAQALRDHLAAQQSRGLPCGPDDPVIVTARATRVHPDIMEKWWLADRAGLNCEGLCLHELRHTYLTQLARAGVHPKVMQALAGHANSAITMEIYTHADMDGKRQAAEQLRASMQSYGEQEEDTWDPSLPPAQPKWRIGTPLPAWANGGKG